LIQQYRRRKRQGMFFCEKVQPHLLQCSCWFTRPGQVREPDFV